MLSRAQKAAYYAVAGPLMRANGFLHRTVRTGRQRNLRVHLGPGQRNYIDGWVNVDANMFTAKCDVWADLRNRLPFADNSVDCMYSHHVIEHLPDLAGHFRDVYRCLAPGGVYRFGGPNGDEAIKAFIANDSEWFSDFPDARRSIGGRLENFIFCRQEHLTLLTESYLREIAEQCGFRVSGPFMPRRETQAPQYFEPCLALEYESDDERPHTLLMEATK